MVKNQVVVGMQGHGNHRFILHIDTGSAAENDGQIKTTQIESFWGSLAKYWPKIGQRQGLPLLDFLVSSSTGSLE
jgi:hypothetical protein